MLSRGGYNLPSPPTRNRVKDQTGFTKPVWSQSELLNYLMYLRIDNILNHLPILFGLEEIPLEQNEHPRCRKQGNAIRHLVHLYELIPRQPSFHWVEDYSHCRYPACQLSANGFIAPELSRLPLGIDLGL